MYSKILVPLDGSNRAEKILPYVEKLAAAFESKVVFLLVVESSFIYASPFTFYSEAGVAIIDREKLREEGKNYLVGLEEEFRSKGIQVKALVYEGPVVQTIIRVAEEEGADLIALASHGRTGMARVFYGSVAAGVLHQVDRPLLIIRSEGEY